MKTKKCFDICKKSGVFYVYQAEHDEQWLSDGSACYPITGLPMLTEDSICKLYDINDTQRNKCCFEFFVGTPPILVSDSIPNESDAEMWDITIAIKDKIVIPISTEEGILFVDIKYLAPFTDMPNGDMRLTIRDGINGKKYVCVKFGLIAYAFIAPVDVINDEFVNKIEKLYSQSKIALSNSGGSIKYNETV